MARLELRLLGGLEATLDGAAVTAFESVKVRALLAYLATEADRPQSREALAALLWPDWPQQSAMRNLRNALADLRQNIGDREAQPPFLLISRDSLQLNREADLWVDVVGFEQGIREQRSAIGDQGRGDRGKGARISDPGIRDRGQGTKISDRGSTIGEKGSATGDLQSKISNLQSKIGLYRGPFLDGFPQTDSPQFEEWVLSKREYYNEQVLKTLGRLAEWGLEQGEYEQAESYARRQIKLEPWREIAYQQLMTALSMRGERAQALAQFENLKKALQRELSAEPSQETFQLYRSIRDEAPEGVRDEKIQGIGDKGKGEQGSATREQETQDREQRIAISDQRSEAISQQSKISDQQSTILHNLPLQLTSFIGREKEIAAVKGLLHSNRLVTLTGPGGTGKTRLSIQTAAGLLDQYADGVWLVELAPVADPILVPAIAARALGLRELPGPQATSLLQEYLEQRQVLLILDNCEHVIEACIRLAEALLQTCPKLTILVSSREALGIAGEVPFRVPPMTLPEGRQPLEIEALGQYEAIRLFVERVATTSPGFTLIPANAPAVLQICQRLDGIPLAIELAAARVKLLPVEEIAGRLDDRFRLLTGGSRAALPRYQTLRACIDWSYVSLSEAERTLLQRLSIFAGGLVLEAAEAVGCGEGIQIGDVLELLGLLVDKSLIQTGNSVAGLYRFRMLETIRQYAHEKLVEAGQAEAVRHRHLQYYLDLAERVEEKIRGPDQAQILDRLEAELDNLRLALAWSLEGRGRPGWDPELGLRLAAALHWFWHCRVGNEEGLRWLEQLLAGEAEERGSRPLTPERTRCRVRALRWAEWSAGLTGEPAKAHMFNAEIGKLYRSLREYGKSEYAWGILYSGAERIMASIEELRLLDEAQAIFQEAGDRFGVTFCIMRRGHIARFHKEYEKAKAYYEQEMALHKEYGDLDGVAGDLMFLSWINYNQGNTEQARVLCEQSMRLFSEVHNIAYVSFQYYNLCEFDMMTGDYAQAAAHASEGLSISRRQGDLGLILEGLLYLGRLALIQGDTHAAAERFGESLAYFRKKEHKPSIARSLNYLGLSAWNIGELEEACKLYAEALTNCRVRGDIYQEVGILCELGKVALAGGELSQAQAQFKQVFNTQVPFPLFEWEDRNPTMLTLEAIAFLVAAQGQSKPAARLLEATEAWHRLIQNTRTPREHRDREACISSLRLAMGEEAFTTAFAEGQAMTEEQAIQLAKEAIDF